MLTLNTQVMLSQSHLFLMLKQEKEIDDLGQGNHGEMVRVMTNFFSSVMLHSTKKLTA